MKQRLQSLDVMRGLTVFMMILVNNGVGHEQFTTLQHSKWNGLTICDLVFPFFLFMVGVSIWLSRKNLTLSKILRRSLRMFIVGVLLHVWDMLLDGQWMFLHDLRIWGVLQRIAICYCTIGLLVMKYEERVKRLGSNPYSSLFTLHSSILIGLLLVAYAALLLLGNGYAPDDTNILCRVDRWLFGEAHLYRKSPIDPEGLLATLPSIAHTLIGVMVGRVIANNKSSSLPLPEGSRQQSTRLYSSLLTLGSSVLLCGLLLSLCLPLKKRVWSPSFVLVTCGLATLLLLMLVYMEMRGKVRNSYSSLFTAFGLNAFFLYVLSEMLSPVMSHIGINEAIYEAMLSGGFNPCIASLCYALFFDGLIAIAAWVLWKRKIFIKI